jgi:hypothetical protein
MDQVVAQALTLYARLCNLSRAEAATLYTEPAIRTLAFPMTAKSKRSRRLSQRRRPVLATS